MPFSEKEKLLQDVLREGDYNAFREEVFRRTRRELRRRHRTPRLRWLALAASVTLGLFLWQSARNDPAINEPAPAAAAVSPGAPAPELPGVAMVTTGPFPETNIVRSLRDLSLLVATDPRGIQPEILVATRTEPAERISDEALLALFPERPAGFILTPSGERRFILWAAREDKATLKQSP